MHNNSNAKTGAEACVDALEDEGVEVVFAITGAGNLALLDEIMIRNSIEVKFVHHEQAAVMAAQGYSRISGKIGVAVVTTGGGTSNALTGILSAYLDSVPLLLISGNESAFHCQPSQNMRAWGVQGFDSVSTFGSVTKKTIRATREVCLYKTTTTLISNALLNRMGPVHLDFPMDLQRSVLCSAACGDEKIVAKDDNSESYKFAVSSLSSAIKRAKRPLFYIGNGCRSDESLYLLNQLLDRHQIPFILSWSAIDLFSDDHPMNIGRVGIYGERSSNLLLQQADLLVCFGTRLAIPQVGYSKQDFARNAEKWIIEVDLTEIQKNDGFGWNFINCDVKNALRLLCEDSNENQSIENLERSLWWEIIHDTRRMFTKSSESEIGSRSSEFVHSVDVIQFLNQHLNNDATVVTDVGAGLLSGHYAYSQRGKRRLFTSQGLGEMGFGLPAAIGAFFAAPERQIVCLNTDGAIMFNLQELESVRNFKIPLKLFIFNNGGYAMIKISQENLFQGRNFGSTIDSGLSFPRFELVARTFGFNYLSIRSSSDLNDQLTDSLVDSTPILIEVMMDPEQKYLPRLATNRDKDGNLVSPPLEDLDPKVPLAVLQRILGTSIHPSSIDLLR